MVEDMDLEMIEALAEAESEDECDVTLLRHQWTAASLTLTQLLTACAQNGLGRTREFARKIKPLAQAGGDGDEAGEDNKTQAVLAKQKDAIARLKEDMCHELGTRLVAIPSTSGPCGQTTEAPMLQTPSAGTVSSASGKSADLQKFKPTHGLKLNAAEVIAEIREPKSIYRTPADLEKADASSSDESSDEDDGKAKDSKRAKKAAGHLCTAEILLNIPAEPREGSLPILQCVEAIQLNTLPQATLKKLKKMVPIIRLLPVPPKENHLIVFLRSAGFNRDDLDKLQKELIRTYKVDYGEVKTEVNGVLVLCDYLLQAVAHIGGGKELDAKELENIEKLVYVVTALQSERLINYSAKVTKNLARVAGLPELDELKGVAGALRELSQDEKDKVAAALKLATDLTASKNKQGLELADRVPEDRPTTGTPTTGIYRTRDPVEYLKRIYLQSLLHTKFAQFSERTAVMARTASTRPKEAGKEAASLSKRSGEDNTAGTDSDSGDMSEGCEHTERVQATTPDGDKATYAFRAEQFFLNEVHEEPAAAVGNALYGVIQRSMLEYITCVVAVEFAFAPKAGSDAKTPRSSQLDDLFDEVPPGEDDLGKHHDHEGARDRVRSSSTNVNHDTGEIASDLRRDGTAADRRGAVLGPEQVAKTSASSADDTLARGRRGSMVNETTATAESGRETTSVHHGAGGDDHFEGDERTTADGHRGASPGDRGAGAGGPEGVPASVEPTRPDDYPWQVTMCDCDWQIAEACQNQCKYHRAMVANGQEHYDWCPAVGGGGYIGSDCSSERTVVAEQGDTADAERPAAEEQPSDPESEDSDRASRPTIVEFLAERPDGVQVCTEEYVNARDSRYRHGVVPQEAESTRSREERRADEDRRHAANLLQFNLHAGKEGRTESAESADGMQEFGVQRGRAERQVQGGQSKDATRSTEAGRHGVDRRFQEVLPPDEAPQAGAQHDQGEVLVHGDEEDCADPLSHATDGRHGVPMDSRQRNQARYGQAQSGRYAHQQGDRRHLPPGRNGEDRHAARVHHVQLPRSGVESDFFGRERPLPSEPPIYVVRHDLLHDHLGHVRPRGQGFEDRGYVRSPEAHSGRPRGHGDFAHHREGEGYADGDGRSGVQVQTDVYRTTNVDDGMADAEQRPPLPSHETRREGGAPDQRRYDSMDGRSYGSDRPGADMLERQAPFLRQPDGSDRSGRVPMAGRIHGARDGEWTPGDDQEDAFHPPASFTPYCATGDDEWDRERGRSGAGTWVPPRDAGAPGGRHGVATNVAERRWAEAPLHQNGRPYGESAQGPVPYAASVPHRGREEPSRRTQSRPSRTERVQTEPRYLSDYVQRQHTDMGRRVRSEVEQPMRHLFYDAAVRHQSEGVQLHAADADARAERTEAMDVPSSDHQSVPQASEAHSNRRADRSAGAASMGGDADRRGMSDGNGYAHSVRGQQRDLSTTGLLFDAFRRGERPDAQPVKPFIAFESPEMSTWDSYVGAIQKARGVSENLASYVSVTNAYKAPDALHPERQRAKRGQHLARPFSILRQYLQEQPHNVGVHGTALITDIVLCNCADSCHRSESGAKSLLSALRVIMHKAWGDVDELRYDTALSKQVTANGKQVKPTVPKWSRSVDLQNLWREVQRLRMKIEPWVASAGSTTPSKFTPHKLSNVTTLRDLTILLLRIATACRSDCLAKWDPYDARYLRVYRADGTLAIDELLSQRILQAVPTSTNPGGGTLVLNFFCPKDPRCKGDWSDDVPLQPLRLEVMMDVETDWLQNYQRCSYLCPVRTLMRYVELLEKFGMTNHEHGRFWPSTSHKDVYHRPKCIGAERIANIVTNMLRDININTDGNSSEDQRTANSGTMLHEMGALSGHFLRGFATSAIFDFANMELVAFGECDMIDRARHTLQSFIKSYYRVTSPDHIGRFRKRLRTNGKILRVEEVLFL